MIARHYLKLAPVCALLLLAAACKKEAPVETAPSAAEPAAPVPAAAAPAVVELSDADLAVSEDFEDDAEKEISESNYKAELSALEKELDAPE
ncbi:MAG: hypothetical protein QM756_47080 [Polyangiaceae bacterium]